MTHILKHHTIYVEVIREWDVTVRKAIRTCLNLSCAMINTFGLYACLNIIPLEMYNNIIPIVENLVWLNDKGPAGDIKRARAMVLLTNDGKLDFKKGNKNDRLIKTLRTADKCELTLWNKDWKFRNTLNNFLVQNPIVFQRQDASKFKSELNSHPPFGIKVFTDASTLPEQPAGICAVIMDHDKSPPVAKASIKGKVSFDGDNFLAELCPIAAVCSTLPNKALKIITDSKECVDAINRYRKISERKKMRTKGRQFLNVITENKGTKVIYKPKCRCKKRTLDEIGNATAV